MVTKKPTVEEEGIITYTCSVCEAQKTATIPKLIDLSDAKVGVVSAMTYTGKALKPEITVTLDGTELTEGVDYTVTYSNNTNVGTAAVKVTGKGSYGGTVNKSFKINGISHLECHCIGNLRQDLHRIGNNTEPHGQGRG